MFIFNFIVSSIYLTVTTRRKMVNHLTRAAMVATHTVRERLKSNFVIAPLIYFFLFETEIRCLEIPCR